MREHASAPHADDVHAVAERIAAEPRGRDRVRARPRADRRAGRPRSRREAGWPLLAEPTSGVRCGDHDRSHVVAHYDVLLRVEGFAREHAPGLVLRVGDMPTSKPLRALVAESPQVVLDPHGAWHEPTRTAELVLQAAAAPTLDALAAALEMRVGERGAGLARGVERAPTRWCRPALEAAPDDFEGKVLASLEPELPDEAVVWVSSSMPIRDVEAYFPQSPKRAALPRQPRRQRHRRRRLVGARRRDRHAACPTWVLIGELALQHDVGGLLAARRAGVAARDRLHQQRRRRDLRLPARRRARRPRRLRGAHRDPVEDVDLAALWPGLREVRTDRRQNVPLHRELVERVAQSL